MVAHELSLFAIQGRSCLSDHGELDGKIKAALPLVDLLWSISELRRAAGKGMVAAFGIFSNDFNAPSGVGHSERRRQPYLALVASF